MDTTVDTMEKQFPKNVSDITEGWLTNILVSYFDCPVIVHSIHKENAVSKGNNFVTNVTRVQLDATIRNKRQNLSLFVKTAPESQAFQMMVDSFALFKRECYVYRVFLPYIAQNFHNHSHPLYYYGRESGGAGVLVLEDLKSRGFTMRNKKDCITLAEARSVITTLAKLHAHGHVIRGDGRFTFEVDLVYTDTPMVQEFEQNFIKSVQSIVTTQFPEFKAYLGSIRKILFPGSEVNFCYKHPNPGKFATIIHGDAWSSNMMFRYHDNCDPEVNLVDWQMTRPNSGVMELAYFLHSSADCKFREQHTDCLLKLYLKTYVEQIKRYIPIREEEYTLDELKQQYEDHKDYRFLIALMFVRIVHDDVVANSVDINSEADSFLDFGSKVSDKSLLKHFKSIMLEFIDNGLLHASGM